MSKKNSQITSFFRKAKNSVAEKQQEIVKDAMDSLWRNSPHFGDSRGDQAMGEYDANHKIQINAGIVSGHNPATGNIAESMLIHEMEQTKTQNIKSGDRVRIQNTTAHANDVEYGGPGWKVTPGYRTYNKAKSDTRNKHQNVLK